MSGMLGLHIGLSAIKAQQRALDVTGHNIANANTEGYSRQRAELTAAVPYAMPSKYEKLIAGQVGTGVNIDQIVRMRNSFLDSRYREEASSLGSWSQKRDALHEVELIFSEPSDSGINQSLTDFWSALQELQNQPEDGATRRAVRQSALSLIDTLHSFDQQIGQYQQALDGYVKDKIEEVNSLSVRISDLNQQISEVVGKGNNPNDLLDKRDLLLDELSGLVDITVNYDSRLKANVHIGGYSLVSGNSYNEITYKEQSQQDGLVAVVWKANGTPVNIENGELGGLFESRDSIVPKFQESLDTLARNLIFEFNKIHKSGYGLDNSTGVNFFTGADAGTIGLSDEIMDPVTGPPKIAAAIVSDPDAAGDGENALLLSNLIQGKVVNNKTSLSDFWAGVISTIGIEGRRAEQTSENQSSLTHQINGQRVSLSGVSLDEEMVNLVKYQHAYGAASRLITVQSEMLDTLVNLVK